MNLIRKNWLGIPSLLISTSVFAFAYGFMSSQYRIFPYHVLREARAACIAIWSLSSEQEIGGLAEYRTQVLVPTAISHANQVDDGEFFLISAGADALKSEDPAGCMAWIIDRDGRVVHTWRNHPHLWDDLQKVTRVPGVSGAINPAGLHVFGNGDLLATFHGYNTYPFAIGIARFDRHSRLLWKQELLTHHCFSVAEDGRIFVPALEIVDSPVRIGQTAAHIESESGKIYNDVILILSPDGSLLRRIPMLEALVASGWNGHLIRANDLRVVSEDPLHLNDVQRLGAALPGSTAFRPDDLLVSFRNINTLGILDLDTQRFKWLSTGASVGQHSPRLYQHGVLVLDNLGGQAELGGTQLVHIAIDSGNPRTLFPRNDVPMPDRCRTINSGHLDVHSDQKRALLAVTHEGAVWEIDLQTGETLWEYIYVDSATATRGRIGSAKYVAQYPFTPTHIPINH